MEVKYASESMKTLHAKMAQWLRNGVRLGFLLNTAVETAHIYRPGQPAETVQGFDKELSGEDVLSGFRLALRGLRPQS